MLVWWLEAVLADCGAQSMSQCEKQIMAGRQFRNQTTMTWSLYKLLTEPEAELWHSARKETSKLGAWELYNVSQMRESLQCAGWYVHHTAG